MDQQGGEHVSSERITYVGKLELKAGDQPFSPATLDEVIVRLGSPVRTGQAEQ